MSTENQIALIAAVTPHQLPLLAADLAEPTVNLTKGDPDQAVYWEERRQRLTLARNWTRYTNRQLFTCTDFFDMGWPSDYHDADNVSCGAVDVAYLTAAATRPSVRGFSPKELAYWSPITRRPAAALSRAQAFIETIIQQGQGSGVPESRFQPTLVRYQLAALDIEPLPAPTGLPAGDLPRVSAETW